jgi:hypothetical protein
MIVRHVPDVLQVTCVERCTWPYKQALFERARAALPAANVIIGWAPVVPAGVEDVMLGIGVYRKLDKSAWLCNDTGTAAAVQVLLYTVLVHPDTTATLMNDMLLCLSEDQKLPRYRITLSTGFRPQAPAALCF